jgi:hypothetical protein
VYRAFAISDDESRCGCPVHRTVVRLRAAATFVLEVRRVAALRARVARVVIADNQIVARS